ncbi:MAG: hypothetical protein GY790_12840 [Bacteroidetes bacterium]|nr:hypothetical protein [Bacteroidota bacterium]
MRSWKTQAIVYISILFMFGCDEYNTNVTNTVHADGSVSRKVIMTNNTSEDFDPGKYQVPLDSSWTLEYSMEISEKQDTVWILTGEKHFESVEAINADYEADTGANQLMQRSARFTKKFRWFNTVYRFEESVEGIMDIDNPIEDYFSETELAHYFLPGKVRESLVSGADSLQYMALADTIESLMEDWFTSSLLKQMILNMQLLLSSKADYSLSLEELQSCEPALLDFVLNGDLGDDFFPDSVLSAVFSHSFLEAHKTDMDSAVTMLDTDLEGYLEAESYDLEIRMPGTIIGSNGYPLGTDEAVAPTGMLWTVSGDYFFVDDYTMWVESKIPNHYAWIISGIFLVFAITGLIRFRRK